MPGRVTNCIPRIWQFMITVFHISIFNFLIINFFWVTLRMVIHFQNQDKIVNHPLVSSSDATDDKKSLCFIQRSIPGSPACLTIMISEIAKCRAEAAINIFYTPGICCVPEVPQGDNLPTWSKT